MGKRAVLVGCNYPGTAAELKGCVNDVRRMHRCLVDRFGFAEDDIVVLIDTDSSYTQPTGANIRRALSDLVSGAELGDILFFHYSGHGIRLHADENDVDDETGYEECIVPCDANLITDDDFRDLVDKVPPGCRFTFVSDSCHSGGLIERTKEQIGESTKRNDQGEEETSSFSIWSVKQTVRDALISFGMNIRRYGGYEADEEDAGEEYSRVLVDIKNRSLPLPTFIEMLKQKTGKDDIELGQIRPTLFEVFGDDASLKVKKFMKAIVGKLHQDEGDGGERSLGMVGSLTQEFLLSKLWKNDAKPSLDTNVSDVAEVYAGGDNRGLPHSGILISGCQTDQKSVDAKPSSGGAYGALSNAIQTILEETNSEISNRELVLRARKMLSDQGFTQRPGLYCSDDHVDAPFIC